MAEVEPRYRGRVGATGLSSTAHVDIGALDLAATAWQVDAACAGLDTDLFFSDDAAVQNAAKRVCAGCPVRQMCLQAALFETHGIWGGASPRARRRQRGTYTTRQAS